MHAHPERGRRDESGVRPTNDVAHRQRWMVMTDNESRIQGLTPGRCFAGVIDTALAARIAAKIPPHSSWTKTEIGDGASRRIRTGVHLSSRSGASRAEAA